MKQTDLPSKKTIQPVVQVKQPSINIEPIKLTREQEALLAKIYALLLCEGIQVDNNTTLTSSSYFATHNESRIQPHQRGGI